ncbi:MAG TPA: error-prone DNA polymerase [Myxococcota bacterium]|nr:error-prone DNA polymerase [Myxococcota bacterium]
MDDFVELGCASAFSFLEGASAPEDLVAVAADLGMDTLAICDRDGLYGAPRFFRAAREAGLRPIVGAELTLANCSLRFLVKNVCGYKNLCRLITRGHRGRPKGQAEVDLDLVEEFSAGLICLAAGGCGKERRLLDRLVGIFGRGDLWLEIGRHLDREETLRNRALVEMSSRLGIGLLASNDVCYARASERRIQDVFTCIREKVTLAEAGRRLYANAERHLKSQARIAELFSDLPQAVRNTRAVAERCAFSLSELDYHFPDFPVPGGETQFSYLHYLAQAGARRRYRPLAPRHMRQLDKELMLIAKLEMEGYFLLVWDICRFCRESGILVQGRGSAANSAVCYVLGITAVDPVGMDLLFERFLSEERGNWPDIDLDLPSGDQREKVIQYVYRRYGQFGAKSALTANVITYKLRSTVREVGKVLGLPGARLAGMLSAHAGTDVDLAAAASSAGFDTSDRRVALLIELVSKMRHLPRHLGQHSGGMVISRGRLDEVVPIEPAAMPGRSVIQWDKDDCADLGIIKVDLLGLGMLRAIEEAIPLVRAHEGVEIDLAHLPADDPAVYAMLRRADTVGVFQVESRAQMNTLPRMQPRCFYDLVVEVALIRPGPIVGKKVHPYLERRAGREPVTYPHPSLKPILERTLGIPLFQEQAMRIAMQAAGYTVGQAEQLRQAMGHRRSLEQKALHEEKLRAGLAARGISGPAADEIIESFGSFFGLYGFPESHAASFALIVYASAYLKVHHPAAFTCALLNAWPMGFYHPATIIRDAKRHGQSVREIDACRSGWKCTIDPDGAVRLGLRFVVGLRREAGERIVSERRRRRFADLKDLKNRCRLRSREMDVLAELGAFSGLGLSRREALWQVAALDDSGRGLIDRLPLPSDKCPLPRMDARGRTAADYRNSGMTVGPHPVAHLRSWLRGRGVLPAAALEKQPHGRMLKVAGQVITRQRPRSARGMCFLTIEDESGLANVVITPDVFERQRLLVVSSAALIVSGRLECHKGVTNLRATRFESIDENDTPSTPSHDFR